MKVKDM